VSTQGKARGFQKTGKGLKKTGGAGCFALASLPPYGSRRRKPPHWMLGAWGLAPTFLFGSFSLSASRASCGGLGWLLIDIRISQQ